MTRISTICRQGIKPFKHIKGIDLYARDWHIGKDEPIDKGFNHRQEFEPYINKGLTHRLVIEPQNRD